MSFPNIQGNPRRESAAVEIPLTRGYVALVDPEDYERVSAFKWYANIRPTDGRLYAYSWMKGRRAMMHRFILDASEGISVDHVNRDSLDNRRSNLRFCTVSQNAANSKNRDNATGFRGVIRRGSSYWGYSSIGGTKILTRKFPCPILAAAARDVLAQELHGDFAALNFEFRRVA